MNGPKSNLHRADAFAPVLCKRRANELGGARKVGRRDVARDLPDVVDAVCPDALTMAPERFRVGRLVDTELPKGVVVADGHVAVLPGDFRELLLGDLLRASTNVAHCLFVDLERSDDQVSRHLHPSTPE